MEIIRLKAYAKINWGLDVISKRSDGYHNVELFMQSINLYDLVTINKKACGINITTNMTTLPNDERNLAYKAATLILNDAGINSGTNIHLQKNIPVAAGLGGGSADAAATLIGLNKLFSLGYNDEGLRRIAAMIGADVAFFISGGTAFAEGIGDKVNHLFEVEDILLLLVKPDIEVLTANVYKMLDVASIKNRPDKDRICEALKMKNLGMLGINLCNVLEPIVSKINPVISEIKHRMLQNGALGSVMSGSGPTVFGIFEDYDSARKLYNSFKLNFKQTFLVKTLSRSVDIVEEL